MACGNKNEEHKEMRPTAAYNVLRLYQRYTDPNQAGMLKELSIETINLKIKSTKRQITVNTIERLMKMKVGTNAVEHASRHLTWGGGDCGAYG